MKKNIVMFTIKASVAYIILNVILGGVIVAPVVLLAKNIWVSAITASVAIAVSLFVSLFFMVKNSTKESQEVKKKGVFFTCIIASIFVVSGIFSDQTAVKIVATFISVALFFATYVFFMKKIA